MMMALMARMMMTKTIPGDHMIMMTKLIPCDHTTMIVIMARIMALMVMMKTIPGDHTAMSACSPCLCRTLSTENISTLAGPF